MCRWKNNCTARKKKYSQYCCWFWCNNIAECLLCGCDDDDGELCTIEHATWYNPTDPWLLVLRVFSEVFDCVSSPPGGMNDPFPLSLDVPDPTYMQLSDMCVLICIIRIRILQTNNSNINKNNNNNNIRKLCRK